MMTGKVVATYSTQGQVNKNSTTENELLTSTSSQYSSVQVATAVTFTVALIQVIISIFHTPDQPELKPNR